MNNKAFKFIIIIIIGLLLFLATSKPKQKYNKIEYHKAAINYFIKGQYDNSVQNFNKFISLNPNCGEAYHNLGLLCHKKYYSGLTLKNIDFKGLIIKALPNILIGGVAIFAGAPPNIVIKQILTRIASQHFSATFKQFEYAIKLFNKAISLNPRNDIFYFSRGTCYFLNLELDAAFADFNKAIQLNKKNYDAYLMRGLIYYYYGYIYSFIPLDNGYHKQFYYAAVNDFNSAISINRSCYDAYYNIGMVYSGLKDSRAQNYINQYKNYKLKLIAHDYLGPFGIDPKFKIIQL